MADLQDQSFSGSAGLDTPIPASIMYDADLSKIFSALAAPLLQSQEIGLSGEDLASSAETNAEDSTPRCAEDQDGALADACGIRPGKGCQASLSDQSPPCQGDFASDLTFAALQALAGHLEGLSKGVRGDAATHPGKSREKCSSRTRTQGEKYCASEEALRRFAASDNVEASRVSVASGRQRWGDERGCGKAALDVERSADSSRSVDALHPEISRDLRLEGLSSAMALFGGRGLKRAASDTFDGEGFDTSPTDSTRSSGDGSRSERRKSPKIGDMDSRKRSDCEILGVDQLLKEDMEDVLELEQATSQLLFSDSDSGACLRETPHKSQLSRGLLDLASPAVRTFDVLASSRSPHFGSGVKAGPTGGQASTSGLPSILPRSFRSRSDYLSLCSLQTGSSDLGKEREPRSLDELKSLAGNEELGLTEIHILAEGLAREFMETCCARLRPEGYRNCRLKYRRDNLSFTVVSSKGWSGCNSPREDGRQGRCTPRSALKEGPWSAGAGMFVAPFGSAGGNSGLLANACGEPRQSCGSSPMGESGVNDSTVAAVVNAFLKATSILADATAQQPRERLGAGDGTRGFRSWSNTKAEYQLEAFRRSA
ncbi:conserved hypothetical protein [Neospora caninum Liverpool]|uniref:Uncharacterized protein n=1 Tax=Neospora caninum (strain Liverpool) TaxID=572307 RepID=F0VA58_NEOCL|nr:conserved hypothetical protein [Neospora caninum Liverpool]CBZ50547.1 conserved hypothetical protein [Neospora caninum Liverpool]CEL65157.1 TPA: hypothetical protein BN1204_010160 [Neospora caninum Liverpool]|eukprot:XP_003880580.1 conserved hypothetical protein [Neospora caninum Liverpool]